jgi:uncharacterized membrane protein YcgQ (UPF0703/DUF1980 family)
MWYEFVIFGFFILWIALAFFSDTNSFIKRHFGTIGFVFISWFHAFYYIFRGRIAFAKGGGIPINYSEQPVTFTFLIIFLFAICILAIYFDEAVNKNINSDKGLNSHINSGENKNIVIPDREYSFLNFRKEYCPHCNEVIDSRATICLSCGESLTKKGSNR